MTNAEFEGIYRTYFNDVYLYVRSLSADEALSEDITSETFFKAIKSIDNFRQDCDIRVWLCQIAKNCYYSYLRKNSKADTVEKIPEQCDYVDIEEQLTLSYTSMNIHAVLHDLEEPYKEVFSLRIFGELSFRQIGAIFGRTENWACVTYHRAKKKILVRMEGYL